MSVVREVELPVGVVTLLFSDIEGSTRLLQELGDLYGEVLVEHHRLLRGVWAGHGGIEVETEGDSFVVAFADPGAAVRAAAGAQRMFAGHAWPHGGTVRVRMAVHTGSPKVRDGHYWGIDVHYAARLCAAASGGQVLVSQSTAALIEVAVEDLGEHALKDFPAPRRLFHLLVDGRGSDQFAPPRTLRAGRTNLPAVVSSFVGRERELEEVCGLLREFRVLTLAGAGGVGKTRLALAAAARLLDGNGDGAWLVELAGLREAGLVGREVARALGVAEEPGRPILDSLVESVAERSLLLVLDNCEHLVGAVAELVAALAARCPGVVVLASSREPLGVAGERVYRVPSLSLPQPSEQSGELERYEAVRLFVERAREHRPGFVVDERNAGAVAAVVRRLDGIPLAIELAAARLRTLAIGELQARLDQSFRLLTGGSRTALPRQQTLAALIDWSYELLPELERRVLARLSVFAGGFDLEGAEAVCAGDGIDELDVIDLLGALVDKSLVQVDDLGERLRYRLLETVRAYAAEKLAEDGEPAPHLIRRAHRDHYLTLAATARPRLETRDQLEWLDRLDADHDNLRAALNHCLADPDPEPGLRLATALERFWSYRGHEIEGARAITVLLQRPQASEPTLVRSRALSAAARLFASRLGEVQLAETYAEQALAIAREHRDDDAAADALGGLGMVRLWQARDSEATELSREGLALARGGGDVVLLASLLTLHCEALRGSGGDPSETVQELMRLCREAGDRIGIGRELSSIGCAELLAGNIAVAREHLQEAAQLADELRIPNFKLHTSIYLGFVTLLDGDSRQARAIFSGAVPLARDTSKSVLPYALLGLALTRTGDDPEQAARLHGTVDRLLEQAGMSFEAFEARLRQENREQLKSVLGEERFEQILKAGRAQPVDEAITDALSE